MLAFVGSGAAVYAILVSRSKDSITSMTAKIAAIVSEAVSPINGRLGVLETKIDVFWRNVAFDAAKILHSPHDSRSDLDALLEAFLDDRLAPGDVADLDQKLMEIRDEDVGGIMDGQPTKAGNKIAAAIVLMVLQNVNAGKRDKHGARS